MKKWICLALLLASFLALFSAEPIAYLVKSKGSVQLYRNQEAVRFANGELLYDNDEIFTGKDAYAAIKYADGGVTVKIFPNSVVRFSAVKQNKQLNKTTVISVGSVFSQISNKIKGIYQAETPNTVASVKGTEFIIRYNANNVTQVIVLEGEVIVQNKDSGKSKNVAQGYSAESGSDGEVYVRETKVGEVTDAEQKEIESVNQVSPKTIRIQMIDANGNIKYLEITY